MLRRTLFVMPLIAWASLAAAETIDGKPAEMARYAKAYIGTGNVRVEMAPYKMGDEEGAVIVFHGIEGEWEDKAINHRKTPGGNNGFSYVTTYHGKEWYTLRSQRVDRGERVDLWIPGQENSIALAPSDGAAQLTSVHDILEVYRQQGGNRSLQLPAQSDRAKEQASTEESLAKDVKSVREACGADVHAKVDWASFKGADTESHSVAGYCGAALDGMRHVCSTKAGQDSIKSEIHELSCSFGGSGHRRISLKGGVLQYQVDFDAVNNDAFVHDFLENNL